MPYKERVELYKQIEASRKRPLVAYVTSGRQGAAAQMAGDVIQEFARQILAIPKEKKRVDILIVSHGGDPTVAWRVISMFRERFEKIGALLPYSANSAATLLALGVDEIVMHPFSNLGPVDPQLTHIRPRPGDDSKPDVIKFGFEDLTNYFNFVRENVGISDQAELQRAFELVCGDAGAISIGVAKRSSQLSLSMGEKLLSLHMDDSNEARAIAESLNKSFYHHGYPVGRKEAEQIGLPIVKPDDNLESLLWLVWQDIMEEMQYFEPFNPAEIVLSDKNIADLLSPVTQVQLPANLPPQALQAVYKNIIQQIQLVSVEPVDYELFQATLESIRCKSEFRTKIKINAIRRPDMMIATNITAVSQKWTFEANPDIVENDTVKHTQ
jgi:hypothetical protein